MDKDCTRNGQEGISAMRLNHGVFLVFISAMLSVALYISCQASEENKTKKFTSFTNKSWRLQALYVAPAVDWDLDGKKETDILAVLEDCEKDDLLILRSDKVVVRNAGKIKCDEEDDQEKQTGVWSFNQGSKKLVLKEAGQAQELTIVEVNDNRLVLSYNWNATSGKAHKITAIYVVKQ